jgi:hypothetical protein
MDFAVIEIVCAIVFIGGSAYLFHHFGDYHEGLERRVTHTIKVAQGRTVKGLHEPDYDLIRELEAELFPEWFEKPKAHTCYIAKPGDSLVSIARMYQCEWWELAKDGPDQLRPGDAVWVPIRPLPKSKVGNFLPYPGTPMKYIPPKRYGAPQIPVQNGYQQVTQVDIRQVGE